MRLIMKIALVLVIIGALNWGLIGFFNWNLVTSLFGELSWLTRIIYILVGISAVLVTFSALTPIKSEQK